MNGTIMTGHRWTLGLAVAFAAVLSSGCNREPFDAAGNGTKPAPETAPGDRTAASKTTIDAAGETARIGGPEDYDAILNKYVQGDYVDYAGLKNNPEDLARFDAFLRWQAQADLFEMSREEKIAFYINAYNACCIKAILDHYPLNSPKQIDGFFDGLKFTVASEELTISEIEYDRLIANYKDMRAHFAVVCADRGCLPLKSSAYKGGTLDEDLEAAAKRFVNDPRQFQVDPEQKEVRVSKIFEWYGEKFLKDPDRPVSEQRPELYLANWVDDEQTRKLLQSGQYKLELIPWDWTLNEKGVEPYQGQDEK